ncbi:NUDIX hydrolase domain-like protein [Aspergillus karnatakaensis]|uniref:NUDIX hydrolase n=1 Tax=Aspergillus karnatakaensis TaxID=1810916 RepID=UPI003CCCBE3C
MTTFQPTYTVAPHLTSYNLPFPTFRASNPQYTHYVGGGLIFSRSPNLDENGAPDTVPTGDREKSNLRILLLQRALTDSYPGAWEGPGGSCEDSDATLLSGVAREVYEETGLNVSHFVDLVAKHEWTRVKPDEVIRAVKFTFLVEVHEARDALVSVSGDSGSLDGDEGLPAARVGDGSVTGLARRWEEMVRLDPAEHQAFEWVGEEEILGEGGEEGKFRSFAQQGKAILEGFRILKLKGEGRG